MLILPLTLKPIIPSQQRRLGPGRETAGTNGLEIFYWEASRQ